jgi:hypothetical protein
MFQALYRRTVPSALIILVLVALFGLARPSSVLAADTDGMNELVANSLRISFGNAAVGGTGPSQTETVTNSFGDDMVTFSSTFVTQGYVVTNNTCGSTLAPLQPCNVDVACKPTKLGYRFGVLAFFYTSADTLRKSTCGTIFPRPPSSRSLAPGRSVSPVLRYRAV